MSLCKAVGIISVLAGFFISFGLAAPTYAANVEYGLLASDNLLAGEGPANITGFTYNVSTMPANTSLRISFSLDGSKWYSSSGTALGWDTMSEGVNTIDLSNLSWNGDSFYYKIEFTSDGVDTPLLDEVSLEFTPAFDGVFYEYFTSGTLTSTNVLDGETVGGILSFEYDATDIPAETGLKVQFSQDGNTWYDADGEEEAYTGLTQGNNTVDLYDLGWTGANLYYQIEFTSDNSDTPTLSEAVVSFAENYISGTVYDADGTTPLTEQTVRVAINGVDHTRTGVSDNVTGDWAIYDMSLTVGDVVTVYLEDEASDAVMVTVVDGSDMTDLNVRKNHLITRHDNGGTMTNAHLDTAAVSGEDDISDIYTVTGGDVTIHDGQSLLISTENTFVPGGDLDIGGSLRANGVFTLSDDLTVGDDIVFDGGTLDVTVNNYNVQVGGSWYKETGSTFVPRSGTVTFNGTETGNEVQSDGQAFYNLTISGTGGAWVLQDDVVVDNDVTLTAGTLDVSATNYAISVGGNWLADDGIFKARQGTVTFNGTSNQTLQAGDNPFYNLTINNTGTSGNNIVSLLADVVVDNDIQLIDGILSAGYDVTIGGDISRTDGVLINTSSNTITLSGTGQTVDPGDIDLASLRLLDSSGIVSLDSSLTLSSLLSIGTGRTLDLGTSIVTSQGSWLNKGLLVTSSGSVKHASSSLALTNEQFIEQDTFSIAADSLYATLTDANRNLDGTVKDTVKITVVCAGDSEQMTLTETGNRTGIFRSLNALSLQRGVSTQNNGVLTCTDGDTVTAAYTDNQDDDDTQETLAAVTDVPAAPTQLQGTAISSTAITYTWQDNSHNETGFKIMDENNQVIAELSSGTTSYTDVGLTRDTAYTRHVVAVNSDGNSLASNTVTVKTRASAPTSVELISPQGDSVQDVNTPTFTFNKAQDEDDGMKEYVLNIGSTTYLIPADENGITHPLTKTHHTAELKARYHQDSIEITIKDSLADNTYVWTVTARDKAGNTNTSKARRIVLDTTPPVISHIMVRPPVIYPGMPVGFSVASTQPTATALLTDNHRLKQLRITLERQNGIGGFTALETRTIGLGSAQATTAYTPRVELERGGVYRLSLQLIDEAGHSTLASRTIRVLTGDDVTRLAEESGAEVVVDEDQDEDETVSSPEVTPDPDRAGTDVSGHSLWRRNLQTLDFRENLSGVLTKTYAWSLDKSGWVQRMLLSVFNKSGALYDSLAGAVNRTGERLTGGLWRINDSEGVVPRMLVSGRETRLQTGERTRQALTDMTGSLFRPFRRVSRLAWHKAQVTYEVWLSREPTRITDVAVSSLTPHSAVIEWETNHLTRTAKVNWGVKPDQAWTGSAFAPDGLSRQHRVEITGLDPATTYYFEIMNQNGDYVFDAYYALTTPADETESQSASFVPQVAVVRVDTTVYRQPDSASEVIAEVIAGNRFRALTFQGGWVSVMLPSRQTGWIQNTDIDLQPQAGETGENRDIF